MGIKKDEKQTRGVQWETKYYPSLTTATRGSSAVMLFNSVGLSRDFGDDLGQGRLTTVARIG